MQFMKAKFYLLIISTVVILGNSCKKEEIKVDLSKPQSIGYSQIDRDYILQFSSYLKPQPLFQNSPTETNFEIGSTIFLKTDLGNFGKMKIKDIYNSNGLTLVINFIVYNTDGSVLMEKVDFVVTINKYIDLDTGILSNQSAEFSWASSGGIYRLYVVDNNVLTYLYAQ